jgi:hypothetical protein
MFGRDDRYHFPAFQSLLGVSGVPSETNTQCFEFDDQALLEMHGPQYLSTSTVLVSGRI